MAILREIQRHLQTSGISASRFGREAVGDPRLVHDLRQGREPRSPMRARIRAYIAATRSSGATPTPEQPR